MHGNASGWWAHGGLGWPRCPPGPAGGLWTLWLPGLLAPPLQLLLETQHVPPRSLGHSVVRVQQTAQPRAPSLSPLSARSPPWAPFLSEPRWAWSVATPGRGLAPPRPGAPAGLAPSNARRCCVKASLSALYKVVGHAAVLRTAAGRCYYPLPARRSRWCTPGPGIIVLLDGKLPLPAGLFA